jgi:ABC-type amino acid transport substrate-binding protein
MNRYVPSTAAAVLLLATSAYAQEPPPLRAAVDGTFAPHAFPNLSGGYQGFNVDLANEIAKRLKRKVVIDARAVLWSRSGAAGRDLRLSGSSHDRDQGARRKHAVHRGLSQH